MGDHYVPRHYLRGFAVAQSIWVYDKRQRTQYQTQVKSTANETGMYSPELESFLANEIEGPANYVLDKLRRESAISPAGRKTLARYLALLWQRVPKGRERALSQIPRVAQQLGQELMTELDAAAKERPDLAHVAEERKREVRQIFERRIHQARSAMRALPLRQRSTCRALSDA